MKRERRDDCEFGLKAQYACVIVIRSESDTKPEQNFLWKQKI